MSNPQTDTEALSTLSYEEGYQQLQDVLERLEAADLPLEELLKLYELGTKLATHCGQKLEEAELRVQQWQPDGSLQEFTVPQDE